MECSAMSCNHFECGGIGHHKDCVRYPESMQSMIDDKSERIKKLESELIKLIDLAQQCDGWECFPSEPLDEAYLVVENKAT